MKKQRDANTLNHTKSAIFQPLDLIKQAVLEKMTCSVYYQLLHILYQIRIGDTCLK